MPLKLLKQFARTTLAALILLSWQAASALAVAPNLPPADQLTPIDRSTAPNNGGVAGLLGRIGNGVGNWVELIAGAAAVIYLIWAGIQYISSAGSPEKAKTARQALVNAVIGIAIVVSAYAIIRLGYSIAISVGTIVNP